MEKCLSIYKCKMVKECTINYQGDIRNSDDVVAAAKALGFTEYSEEYFGVFYLNAKGNIIGYCEVSHGELSSTIVHPREVYKRAIVSNCAAIIAIHNHPSGDVSPSEEDIEITKRLVEAGNLLGIPVLDHIIIGEPGNHFSMCSQGILNGC